MRIKIIRPPRAGVVDGVDLRRFTPGEKYDVGSQLRALLLAEGWAEPLADDEPARIIPFSENDPFDAGSVARDSPPNLIRETHPPSIRDVAIAADFERRRRFRRKPSN